MSTEPSLPIISPEQAAEVTLRAQNLFDFAPPTLIAPVAVSDSAPTDQQESDNQSTLANDHVDDQAQSELPVVDEADIAPCQKLPQVLFSGQHFTFTPQGIEIRDGITDSEVHACELYCTINSKSALYGIGDLLHSQEARYGKTFTEAVKLFKKPKTTLAEMKRVCARVNHDTRPAKLSFYQAAAVANRSGYPRHCKTPEQQEIRQRWEAETVALFEKAERECLTVKQIRELVGSAKDKPDTAQKKSVSHLIRLLLSISPESVRSEEWITLYNALNTLRAKLLEQIEKGKTPSLQVEEDAGTDSDSE